MTSCDHLLTLFLVRADAATSKTSDIFEVTLCYHLHFSVWPRLPVSHLHPVEVLTCICVSVSFGTQFAIKVRKRLKFFAFFFFFVLSSHPLVAPSDKIMLLCQTIKPAVLAISPPAEEKNNVNSFQSVIMSWKI